MNCLICHEPVADHGETMPKSVHLGCMGDFYTGLERVQRRVELRRMPGGGTILFPHFGPLKPATETETTITVTRGQHGRMNPDGTWDVENY